MVEIFMVEKFGVEKFLFEQSGVKMSFKLIVRAEFFNPVAQKLMVEKFKIEKSGVEMSRVEKFMV